MIVKFGLRLSFASDSRRNGSLKSSTATNPKVMEKSLIVLSICLTVTVSFIASAPQQGPETLKYTPYNYDYKVEDAEKKLFFDKAESQDAAGKVRNFITLRSFVSRRGSGSAGEEESRDK